MKGNLGGLQHTWSLAVEEHFYLAWPLFLGFSLKRAERRIILASTLALAVLMLATVAKAQAFSFMMFWPTGRGGGVLLGCALAIYGRPIGRARLLAGAGAIGLTAAVILGNDRVHGGAAATLAALSATGLIGGILQTGPLTEALSCRAVVWLGQRSYGIYLWHLPIAYVVGRTDVTSTHGSLRVLIPTLVGSIALAAISYAQVEKRFRQRSVRSSAAVQLG